MIKIAPSILASDLANLGPCIERLACWGADWVHYDVMDGHFTDKLSFGPVLLSSIRKYTELPIDVHLMIEDPIRWIKPFKEAGADAISVHVEADRHIHRTLQFIQDNGMLSAVAINPGTPVSMIYDCLPFCDYVLIMSVDPGCGGSGFIDRSLTKIIELKQLIDKEKLTVEIEVDGGINVSNAQQCVSAGADILVAGSSIFRSEDPEKTIKQLKTECVQRE